MANFSQICRTQMTGNLRKVFLNRFRKLQVQRLLSGSVKTFSEHDKPGSQTKLVLKCLTA